MTSESPGKINDEDFHPCDRTQCLDNATTNSAIIMKPSSSSSSNVILFHVFFLILVSVSGVVGDGMCDPLLCTCQAASANCSYRGFLSLPSGLQTELRSLDLSNNDIQEINRTELIKYDQLEHLDLSRNIIISFEGVKNSKLIRLDLSHNQISSLRRVSVAQMNKLVFLDLSYNKIASVPSKIFPSKSKLEFLNLASNNIEILESECFTQLENLKELKLNRNKLSSLPKLTFFKLKSLESLELNKNKLEKIPGLTFHGLRNVKILKLRKNNLRYLDDGAFYGLDSIEQLYLDRNQVVTVNKGWLYGLVTLQVLSLSYNQVDYIEDDGWDFCKQVYNLNLQGNQLEIVERNILRRLPSLKFLNLKDNLISHIDAKDTFAEVPLLEELHLDNNQLSHTIEDTQAPFKHLTKLRVLGLSGNSIKSVGNLALIGLDSLETLDLSDNVISTIQESPVSHLKHLSRLHLNSSSLLCDCNLRWFAEYVNTTGVRGVSGSCAHPEVLKDRLVTSIASEQFTCEDFPKPYILVEPQSQIALRGKDLSLSCQAASTSPAPMTFVWKKDGTILELGECDMGHSCIENIAHSFDGKGMEVTSQLKLVNLTHMDIGTYQCIVDNVYGATYSSVADITVYVFPQFISRPADKTVTGGNSVTLKCSATGVPQPDISWQKDSGSDFPAARERRMHVDPDTDTYVITNVKAEDMGVYTCSATNLAGSITTNISINVLEIPRFVKPMLNKTVSLGDTAVLQCQSSGAPRPSLIWTKNNGQLVPTERHFFTADNQLLIIVKVEEADQGEYTCTMINNLATVQGSSFLSIHGSGSGHGKSKDDDSSTSAAVIVTAVVSCVIGTSAVWLVIICWTRSRTKHKDWPGAITEMDGVKDAETPTTGMPLLKDDRDNDNDEDDDDNDSGTGDSKKSCDNDIVDTVIHNFLAARGDITIAGTSLSDFDTGISSLGDSSLLHSLHRRGCPKAQSQSLTGQQTPGPQVASVASVEAGVAGVTYAVDNPLYDSLPANNLHVHDNQDTETVSSVTSSVTMSDLPITFNTFHPLTTTNSQSSSTRSKQRKRLSAIETSTGETFLQIDTPMTTISPANLEKDVGGILAAKEYRGGGTLPRNGLQQAWLEASLKYTEDQAKIEMNNLKERGSRRSIFRQSRRSFDKRNRSRRRSTGSGSVAGSTSASATCQSGDEHSMVGSKTTDMF